MKRNLAWTDRAWTHYLYWQSTDIKMVRKINQLIQEILRHPFEGTGKPEALKNELSGLWSRRINDEHRLVYGVTYTEILIYQCRYHYEK